MLGGVHLFLKKERWFIFRVMLQAIGKMPELQFFKPYDFPKIEEDLVCLSLGKRSERVIAERGTGSIKVAISWQSHSKKKKQEGVFSNLLHTVIVTLPASKLRCVYYAHTVKKNVIWEYSERACKVLKQHTWQLLKQNFKDLASLKSHQAAPHPLPLLATASLGANTRNHL